MYSNAFANFLDFPTKTSTKALNRASVSSCVGGGSIRTQGGGAGCRCLARRPICPPGTKLPVGIAAAKSRPEMRVTRQDKICILDDGEFTTIQARKAKVLRGFDARCRTAVPVSLDERRLYSQWGWACCVGLANLERYHPVAFSHTKSRIRTYIIPSFRNSDPWQ